ncbi:MAG: thiamine phosphate synthase [Myxococcota bacterium]
MTDRRVSRHPLAEAVEAAVSAGVGWVQLRERDLDGAALLALAEEVKQAAAAGARARGGEVKLLVNRRIDVALALPADGVHLGFDAMPPHAARELLGAEALLGLATHSPAEARCAAHWGLDYLLLAPIFEPFSKPGGRRPLGTSALSEASQGVLPVLAQGGIDPPRAASACGAGAAGVAVTGAILQAADPAEAAAGLRAALDG